jgi:hypothetical protein
MTGTPGKGIAQLVPIVGADHSSAEVWLMHHIVLLGDSIFDNGVYVGGEPDFATHSRQLVPDDWKVTLCALDGSRTGDIIQRLK